MPQLRAIEIDFDVHKMIESERRSFDEPHHVALRRLLKLPELEEERTPSAGRAWTSDGVTLPHKTALRMTYGVLTIEGEIVDGKWVCEGRSFDTPSAAASALALTKGGETTSLNGWNYWEAKTPGSAEWVPIRRLRTPDLVVKRRKL